MVCHSEPKRSGGEESSFLLGRVVAREIEILRRFAPQDDRWQLEIIS